MAMMPPSTFCSNRTAEPISGLMYDFACEIAASEIFPSLAFSFKPLDPTVLVQG